MNRYRLLLAGLAWFVSSKAYAGGGFGDSLGALLQVLLLVAAGAGLILAVLGASLKLEFAWKKIALFTGLPLLIAIILACLVFLVRIPELTMFAIFIPFLLIPALVFVVVCSAVFYVIKRFTLEFAATSPLKLGAAQPRPATQRSAIFFYWLAVSYLSAILLSLLNLDLLGFLLFPPLLLIAGNLLAKFFPFILPPLLVAALLASILTIALTYKFIFLRKLAPLIFNVLAISGFFYCAELYQQKLMATALRDHKPEQFWARSFFNNVRFYQSSFASAHAGFVENGADYIWSYAERKFILIPKSGRN